MVVGWVFDWHVGLLAVQPICSYYCWLLYWLAAWLFSWLLTWFVN